MPDTQTNQQRRDADRVLMDIETMIIKEDDPQQRAFLVVMNSINISLVANTRTVTDIGRKLEAHLVNFETHTKHEEALMNKGKGAWNILAWVLSIAQIGVIGAYVNMTNGINSLASQVHTLMVSSKEIETRIDSVEHLMDLTKTKP